MSVTYTTPPVDATLGYVTGRWIRSHGSFTENPDFVAESGEVWIIATTPIIYGDPDPADDGFVGVSPHLTICTLNESGDLCDQQGNIGVWLVPGTYKVRTKFKNSRWPEFLFPVSTENTEENPVDLLEYSPITEIEGYQMVVSVETAEQAAASAAAALVSETNAALSATTAEALALSASNSASDADSDRIAAQTAATTATTKADEASASALSASNSASDADSDRIAAEAAAARAEAIDLTIGIVTTAPTGDDASASITGEIPTFELNLDIPRGDPGIVSSDTQPTDPTVQYWIDTDEPSPTQVNSVDGRTGDVSLSDTYVAQADPASVAGLSPTTDGEGGYSWEPGGSGLPGADGDDGREVELQTSATHVQWRYVGDVTWTDLIALSAITGPAGADGAAGVDGDDGLSVELQTTATHIQWRLVGGTWADLVALSTITGPAGAGGSLSGEGQPVGAAPIGTVYVDTLATAGAQVWVYTGTTWEVLIGDTGWRQLGALAVPPFDKDWTSLKLRRVGALVYMQEAATYMLNDGATQLDNPIRVLTLPSAFRGGENIHLKTGVSGITFQIGGDGWFSGVVPSNMTILKADLSIITWPASQPWPATLPGEAV